MRQESVLWGSLEWNCSSLHFIHTPMLSLLGPQSNCTMVLKLQLEGQYPDSSQPIVTYKVKICVTFSIKHALMHSHKHNSQTRRMRLQQTAASPLFLTYHKTTCTPWVNSRMDLLSREYFLSTPQSVNGKTNWQRSLQDSPRQFT
jgi:hypothetical protein